MPNLLFDLEIRLSFVWSTEVTKDNPFYLRDCRVTSSAIRDTPRTTSTRSALLRGREHARGSRHAETLQCVRLQRRLTSLSHAFEAFDRLVVQ